MSILNIGTKCTSCHTQDFLPLTCESCHEPFCSAHISSHTPCTSFGSIENNVEAGPSTFRPRDICQWKGCGRFSIEGIAGRERSVVKEERGKGEEIAKEIRCFGCGGSYCVEHRAQTAHSCTAPLAHQVRHDASIVRKANARAILGKTFPDQVGRVIPKPPPAKEDSRKPPSRQHPPKTVIPELGMMNDPGSSGDTAQTAKPVKTKEDKLWDVHVRKVRSLATPLLAESKATGERVFFEYGLGSSEDVKQWEEGGTWAGKVDRSWVAAEIPIGRIFDTLITSTKTPRPKDPSDPTQALSLVLMSTQPGLPRKAVKLDTSQPAGKAIPDGTMVLLCKGWIEVHDEEGRGV